MRPTPGTEPGPLWATGQDWAHEDVTTATPVARVFETREENSGTVRRHIGDVKKNKSKFLETKREKSYDVEDEIPWTGHRRGKDKELRDGDRNRVTRNGEKWGVK